MEMLNWAEKYLYDSQFYTFINIVIYVYMNEYAMDRSPPVDRVYFCHSVTDIVVTVADLSFFFSPNEKQSVTGPSYFFHISLDTYANVHIQGVH